MPVEEIQAGLVVEALQALDSHAIAKVAIETGFGERQLWRYRSGERPIPDARVRPLARVLGLLSPRARDATPA